MTVLPVDEKRFRSEILSVVEVVAHRHTSTEQQKATRSGIPLWTLRLLIRPDGIESRRPEVVEVRFPADYIPPLDYTRAPRFCDLKAFVWKTDTGTQDITYWASAVGGLGTKAAARLEAA